MPGAPGRVIWAHTDSSGDLKALAEQARSLARSGTWQDDEETERLARVWLLDVLGAVAGLGPLPLTEIREGDPVTAPLAQQLPPGRRFLIDLRQASRPDDFDFQNAIVVAVAALASGHGQRTMAQLAAPDGTTTQITTLNADPPTVNGGASATGPIATAVLPAGVIGATVIISCVGLIAGAVGWISSQFFQARAVGLTADAKGKQAATAIQAAVDVVERHQAAQVARGQTLAYDAGELAVLETLRGSIKELSGWDPPALRSSSSTIGGALASLGQGMGIGTAIVIAVAAWLFFSQRGKRAA